MPMGPDPNPNTASAIGLATMARLEHGTLETRRRPPLLGAVDSLLKCRGTGRTGSIGMWRGEFSQKGDCHVHRHAIFCKHHASSLDMLLPVSPACGRNSGLRGRCEQSGRGLSAHRPLWARGNATHRAGARVQSSVRRPTTLNAASAPTKSRNRQQIPADTGPCLAVCSTHRCVPSRRRTPADPESDRHPRRSA